MSIICSQCRRTIEGEGIVFCPYCGAKQETETSPSIRNEETEQWLRKARAVTSYPEKKKILEQAKAACPDDPEIEWELLFIGTPDPKPPRGKTDYSIIRSWLLQIYRTPDDFSAEKRNAMRQELFDNPQLKAVLENAADPEGKMREYLERLSREYVDIFLKEDNQLMGNLFGLRIGRNRTKILEDTVSGMIQKIEADGQLTPERKRMLQEALIRALGR